MRARRWAVVVVLVVVVAAAAAAVVVVVGEEGGGRGGARTINREQVEGEEQDKPIMRKLGEGGLEPNHEEGDQGVHRHLHRIGDHSRARARCKIVTLWCTRHAAGAISLQPASRLAGRCLTTENVYFRPQECQKGR